MKKRFFALILPIFLSACTYVTPLDSPQQEALNHRVTSNYQVELGMAYLKRGEPQRAKAPILAALKARPNWPPALDAMGYYHEKTGDAVLAESFYLKALKAMPGNGESQNNYGAFLCRQKEYKKSITHFMNAIQDPDYLNTAAAYENAGLCAAQIPEKQQAAAYFEKAIKLDPHSRASLISLAEIQYDTGHNKKARSTLNEYTAITTVNARAVWLSYRLAKKEGDKKRATRAATLLKARFKKSKEYTAYQASLTHVPTIKPKQKTS